MDSGQVLAIEVVTLQAGIKRLTLLYMVFDRTLTYECSRLQDLHQLVDLNQKRNCHFQFAAVKIDLRVVN